MYYRDHKNFSNNHLRTHVINELSVETIRTDSNCLEKNCKYVLTGLDKFAPKKKKNSRGNNMPFMNTSLRKAHMKRSRLRNRFLKTRSEFNKISYNKQRNLYASLLRKTKWGYYYNLNEKDVTDNKQFRRTVKPLLLNKIKSPEKLTLLDNEDIVADNEKEAQTLNNFFSNAIKQFEILEFSQVNPAANNISYLILKAILKYETHPSTVGYSKY